MSSVSFRGFAAALAVLAFPIFIQPAAAADLKRPVTVQAQPSGSELVGRLLAEQNAPSNPDVPLPQRGLSLNGDSASSASGPKIFGRQETGGAVLGLTFAIPAARAAN